MKLNEAYQTLSHEHRRILYDQKLREEDDIPADIRSDDDLEANKWAENLRRAQETWDRREREAQERTRRAKQEEAAMHEWLARIRVKIEKILRLRHKIQTIEANIKDIQEKDRQVRKEEEEARSRAKFRTSIWAQSIEALEKENEQKRWERLQQRMSQGIRLSWLESELGDLEGEHEKLLDQQSRQWRQRARELEAELRATMDAIIQREARRKKEEEEKAAENLAEEQQARRWDHEDKQKEVERLRHERTARWAESRRAEELERERERERKEWDMRRRLHDKMARNNPDSAQQHQSPIPRYKPPHRSDAFQSPAEASNTPPDPRSAHTLSPSQNTADATHNWRNNGPTLKYQRTPCCDASRAPDASSRQSKSTPIQIPSPSKGTAAATQDWRDPQASKPRRYQPIPSRTGYSAAYDSSLSSWRSDEAVVGADDYKNKSCRHGSSWNKIQGGQNCSSCSRFCNAYVLKCPDCGVKACASCVSKLPAAPT